MQNSRQTKKYEAENQIKNMHYSESISASQECIELSIKSTFILLKGGYSKKHDISEEEFEVALKEVPENLKHLEFPKLYLYSKFWSQFYTISKYGLEKIGIGADKLFEKEEAELALKHAEKNIDAARRIVSYIRYKNIKYD
jgi:HEPN domain-containing protein